MRDVTIVDQDLQKLNDEEIELHSKKTIDVIERDARDQAIAAIRRRRVELLTERRRAVAAEMVARATKLRRQAVDIRSSVRSHAEALLQLEGIRLEGIPGRKSDDLEHRASLLDREARRIASARPLAAGNVRANSLEGLIKIAFADVKSIPPSIETICTWAAELEVRRFGGLAPRVARGYHLIWRNGEIDAEQSSVTWMVARAEVA